MVSFRKSLMVVALLALCAGMVMAQTTNTTNVIVLRAEGVTEPLDMGGIVINSTLPGNFATGNYQVTLFSNTTNITSNPGKNAGADGDIVLYPCANPAGVPACMLQGVHGIINANSTSVTFGSGTTPVAFHAVQSGDPVTASAFTVTITGIRVDVSVLSQGGPSFASGVSFTLYAQPTDQATPAGLFATTSGGSSPIYTAQNVAYAIPTFGFALDKGFTSITYLQCDAAGTDGLSDPTNKTPSFQKAFDINFVEGFSKSFQTMDQEGLSATQGTRLAATFTGFPANVTLWVPISAVTGGTILAGSDPAVIDPTTTINVELIAGAGSDGSGGKAATATSGWVAVTPGTPVVFEVTQAAPNSTETVTIPVAVSFSGLPALSAAAGTVTGNYAPKSTVPMASATAPIPRFITTPVALTPILGIDACTTTLLFPYVTTAPGWNVGLAVSNTGATPAADTMLGGTCAFSFYGATGAPAAPVTLGAGGFGDTTPIASGSTGQDLASNAIGAGTSFTGYAFAVCDFTGAQGFAFPFASESNGYISTGYLAKVVRNMAK